MNYVGSVRRGMLTYFLPALADISGETGTPEFSVSWFKSKSVFFLYLAVAAFVVPSVLSNQKKTLL